MKIVFYSTNSNYFDKSVFHYTNFPSNFENLTKLCNEHPDDDFYIFTQEPGMFLIDQNDYTQKPQNVELFIENSWDINDFYNHIVQLSPDLVFAATFWVTPFDWLQINDAMLAQKLNTVGIRTICHNLNTAISFFDKHKTQTLLNNLEFNIPKGIYVHHEMFWAERNRHEIKKNFYKNYVFEKIRSLKCPLIIKDTLGLSSYGMEVVKTHNQAIGFLSSKKNNGDKIVEEYIQGIHFGTEIHGCNGNYVVYDPYIFSTNQYGITSPKQSVKLGPVSSNRFKVDELKKSLLRLANELKFCGIAQVDLIFNGDKWYIVEINPRLSGLTQTIGCGLNKTIYELMLNSLNPESQKADFSLSIKLPILSQETIYLLQKHSFIKHISQTVNDGALQKRETGYCEIIITSDKSIENLLENLNQLKELYPEIIEPVFYNNSMNLYKTIL